MPTFENPRQTLVDLFQVAVQRAMPLHTLGAHRPVPPAPGGRTMVLGAGKAAAAMALALETLWPAHVRAHGGTDTRLSGLVVTRYGHLPPRPADVPAQIEVADGGQPRRQRLHAAIKQAERHQALAIAHRRRHYPAGNHQHMLRALADAKDGIGAFKLAERIQKQGDPKLATDALHYFAIAAYQDRGYAVGRMMPSELLCTSKGGLATTPSALRLVSRPR